MPNVSTIPKRNKMKQYMDEDLTSVTYECEDSFTFSYTAAANKSKPQGSATAAVPGLLLLPAINDSYHDEGKGEHEEEEAKFQLLEEPATVPRFEEESVTEWETQEALLEAMVCDFTLKLEQQRATTGQYMEIYMQLKNTKDFIEVMNRHAQALEAALAAAVTVNDDDNNNSNKNSGLSAAIECGSTIVDMQRSLKDAAPMDAAIPPEKYICVEWGAHLLRQAAPAPPAMPAVNSEVPTIPIAKSSRRSRPSNRRETGGSIGVALAGKPAHRHRKLMRKTRRKNKPCAVEIDLQSFGERQRDAFAEDDHSFRVKVPNFNVPNDKRGGSKNKEIPTDIPEMLILDILIPASEDDHKDVILFTALESKVGHIKQPTKNDIFSCTTRMLSDLGAVPLTSLPKSRRSRQKDSSKEAKLSGDSLRSFLTNKMKKDGFLAGKHSEGDRLSASFFGLEDFDEIASRHC